MWEDSGAAGSQWCLPPAAPHVPPGDLLAEHRRTAKAGTLNQKGLIEGASSARSCPDKSRTQGTGSKHPQRDHSAEAGAAI